MTEDNSGWSDYEKLVLFRLTMIETNQHEMTVKQAQMSNDLTNLKTRSTIWGATSGGIAALGTLIIQGLFGSIGGKH